MVEDDLRLLDSYRRSFSEAYEYVVTAIRSRLGLEPTGRPTKSTTSVIEKLRRESIRLSQIQDIAGCRLIVDDIVGQSTVVANLESLFSGSAIIDRREHPSHGYRAVHIVVKVGGKPVEIQVRSSLQHLWAELSEKYSDVVDPAIKYGGGPSEIRKTLTMASATAALHESLEQDLADLRSSGSGGGVGESERSIAALLDKQLSMKQKLIELLREMIVQISEERNP